MPYKQVVVGSNPSTPTILRQDRTLLKENMKTTIDSKGDKRYAVIHLEGDIDASNSNALLKEIEKVTDEEIFHVILEMSEVKFLSSSGIGVISVCAKDVTNKGGDFSVVITNKRIIQLLDMTGMTRIMSVEKSLEHSIERV